MVSFTPRSKAFELSTNTFVGTLNQIDDENRDANESSWVESCQTRAQLAYLKSLSLAQRSNSSSTRSKINKLVSQLVSMLKLCNLDGQGSNAFTDQASLSANICVTNYERNY